MLRKFKSAISEKSEWKRLKINFGDVFKNLFQKKSQINIYRGFFDIIAEILEYSQSESIKANLISFCNLSFKQLENYLDYLIKTQLLCTEKSGKLNFEYYKITSKGKEFLNNYYNLKTLMLNDTE